MRETKAKAAARPGGALVWVPLSFLLLAAGLSVGGCNTMSGIGEDVSAAGRGIDRTSENTQEKLRGDRANTAPSNQAGSY